MARYEHTQRGKLHLILLAAAALLLALTLTVEGGSTPVYALLLGAVVLFVGLAGSFTRLTVTEHADHLRVTFGPLPLAARRLVFADVRSVRVARSALIDGWGIHWIPGRGWTWNLWGFDCVEIEFRDGKGLRLGTDDAPRLAALLNERAGDARASA